MTHTAEELVAFLRAAVLGVPLPEGFAVRDFGALFALARRQDLGHLLSEGLTAVGAPETVQKAAENDRLRAVWRVGGIAYESERIGEAFTREGIAYLPLKGAVLRSLWPEPWMRTSCDIDILVHEEDAPRAAEVLSREFGYTVEKQGYHDHSMWSPGRTVHLELHFSLREAGPADAVLARVWEFAIPDGGARYRLEPAFLLFHQMAHLAAHVLGGGGGVRPVIDIFYLRRLPYDEILFASLCREGGLATFAEAVLLLADVWFGEGEHTPVTQRLAAWLVEGQLYADLDRRAAVEKAKGSTLAGRRAARRARRAYMMRRLFLPRRVLAVGYPILNRHAWLMPFCQMHRWLRYLFGGRLRVSARRARAAARVTPEAGEGAALLLLSLDLLPKT